MGTRSVQYGPSVPAPCCRKPKSCACMWLLPFESDAKRQTIGLRDGVTHAPDADTCNAVCDGATIGTDHARFALAYTISSDTVHDIRVQVAVELPFHGSCGQ